MGGGQTWASGSGLGRLSTSPRGGNRAWGRWKRSIGSPGGRGGRSGWQGWVWMPLEGWVQVVGGRPLQCPKKRWKAAPPGLQCGSSATSSFLLYFFCSKISRDTSAGTKYRYQVQVQGKTWEPHQIPPNTSPGGHLGTSNSLWAWRHTGPQRAHVTGVVWPPPSAPHSPLQFPAGGPPCPWAFFTPAPSLPGCWLASDAATANNNKKAPPAFRSVRTSSRVQRRHPRPSTR